MDVFIQGNQSTEEAVESLASIIRLFKERYGVEHFREMHLSMTLMDDEGMEVELVDNQTAEVFRVFQVYHSSAHPKSHQHRANLRLVIDNTK